MFKDDDKHETCYCENCLRLQQALDEIEKNIKDYCKYMCMAETSETCEGCQITEIQDIINNTRSK